MKKLSIIDMGTNSTRMLIVQIEGETIKSSWKYLETTRLGQGINQGIISEAAQERNIQALRLFKKEAEEKGVEKIIVFGTSALRDGKNSGDFIRRVKNTLGLSIKVLTGEEEAQMGFMGAAQGFSKKVGVIDIGGGSTEFIMGDSSGIKEMVSADIGAVRMSESYIKNDPIKDYEIHRLEETIKNKLQNFGERLSKDKPVDIIGIGGTITSLAAIKQNLKVYRPEKIHHSKLYIEDIRKILERLIPLTLVQRKNINGLHPGRADIIIAGTIILKVFMEKLRINSMFISDKDNLEGMVYHYLRSINKKT